MLVSGIEVPKLGSVKDQTLRAFMQKKAGREVTFARLVAQIALSAGNGDKTWSSSISNIWKDYTRAMNYQEAEHKDIEQDLLEQYKKFAHIRPHLFASKDGKLQVKGIPKSVL